MARSRLYKAKYRTDVLLEVTGIKLPDGLGLRGAIEHYQNYKEMCLSNFLQPFKGMQLEECNTFSRDLVGFETEDAWED